MEWFNPWGLALVAIIMIPNIVYMKKCPNCFDNYWNNKAVEVLEQIGRYGCFILSVFNVPFTYWGFTSDGAFVAYLILNAVLAAAYCLIWIICFRSKSVLRALSLSIIPSAMFLLDGLLLQSALLIAAAAIFAPCHILLSYKNTVIGNRKESENEHNSK